VTTLPVRKYIKVWIKRRKNRTSTSYTLQWVEYGKDQYLSLGPHATLAYAKEAARQKEAELNSFDRQAGLKPIRWADFTKKYFDTFYPGHDLPPRQRKEKTASWFKSFKTFKREKNAIDSFTRLVKPGFCHELTAEDRERFIQKRMPEVGSALTVDAELRAIRHLSYVMEEWKHRPENSNPFAGRGKATVGRRRKRAKERGQEEKERHYTFEQVQAILKKATAEALDWPTKRLQALVYFVAYTGCRINEATHLEWKDIDWERGIAWLYFKVENDLKTEGSEAPFGLPDRLLNVLREWEKEKTCDWVFPNNVKKPWKTGAPGYRPFDQLQALGERAGVKNVNFKRFRHTLSTLGKGRFGMTREQVQAQLRHTTTETQKHYDHDDLANLRNAMKGINFES
jgi:integrase